MKSPGQKPQKNAETGIISTALHLLEKYSKPISTVFIISVSILVFFSLLIPQGPPTWDGSDHGFQGLRSYKALESRDFALFKKATLQQTLWPFLHSWIIATCSFIYKPSFTLVRTISFAFWLGTALLAWSIGRKIAPAGYSGSTGFLCTIFILSSPMMILYAVQPMLEMPGAFMTLIVLYTVIITESRPVYSSVIPAILIVLTFFLKYVYALLIVESLCVFFALETIRAFRNRNLNRRFFLNVFSRLLVILLPFAAAIAVWFSNTNALEGFLAFKDNPNSGLSLLSPLNWIAYPMILILYYFSTPLLAIALTPAFFSRQVIWKTPGRRLLCTYVCVSLITLTLYHYKLSRAVFTVFPPLAILCSVGLVMFLYKANRSRLRRFISGIIVCILIAHIPLFFFPGIIFELNPLSGKEADHMLNFDRSLEDTLKNVAERLRHESNFAVVGHSHQISPALISWYVFMEKDTFPNYLPSLLRWDRPIKNPNLHRLMTDRNFKKCLVIEVVSGSKYESEDYLQNYAWMSRSLNIDHKNLMSKLWTVKSESGIRFTYYQLK